MSSFFHFFFKKNVKNRSLRSRSIIFPLGSRGSAERRRKRRPRGLFLDRQTKINKDSLNISLFKHSLSVQKKNIFFQNFFFFQKFIKNQDSRDSEDSEDPQDSQDSQDSQDPQDSRDSRDSRGSRDSQGSQDSRGSGPKTEAPQNRGNSRVRNPNTYLGSK